jgi:hypothetical protein
MKKRECSETAALQLGLRSVRRIDKSDVRRRVAPGLAGKNVSSARSKPAGRAHMAGNAQLIVSRLFRLRPTKLSISVPNQISGYFHEDFVQMLCLLTSRSAVWRRAARSARWDVSRAKTFSEDTAGDHRAHRGWHRRRARGSTFVGRGGAARLSARGARQRDHCSHPRGGTLRARCGLLDCAEGRSKQGGRGPGRGHADV